MSKKYKPENRPDTSPKVQQRDKIKEEFEIREFNWTEKQKNFINIALDKNTKIVICQSCPGTGKTLLSLFCSLVKLKIKLSSHFIYIRNPIESASKGIGYIPGDQKIKMEWVCEPLNDHLYELLSKDVTSKLINENRIQGLPLGYIKGRTWHVSSLILDEAEDLTLQELQLVMGRVGQKSLLFCIGDLAQANIKNSGFKKVFDLFNNQESKDRGIYCLTFEKSDIKRNEFLSFVIDKFESLNTKLAT